MSLMNIALSQMQTETFVKANFNGRKQVSVYTEYVVYVLIIESYKNILLTRNCE